MTLSIFYKFMNQANHIDSLCTVYVVPYFVTIQLLGRTRERGTAYITMAQHIMVGVVLVLTISFLVDNNDDK